MQITLPTNSQGANLTSHNMQFDCIQKSSIKLKIQQKSIFRLNSEYIVAADTHSTLMQIKKNVHIVIMRRR